MRRTLAALLAAVLCLAACEAEQPDELTADEAAPDEDAQPVAEPEGADLDRPVVVSTSAPLSELAREVLGERGTVRLLPPLGDTEEDRRPEVDDLVLLVDADVVVGNGLFHDDRWIEYAEVNLREEARLVRLADDLVARDAEAREASFSQDRGAFHPYLWRDLTYAVDYVGQIADTLAEVDPDGEDAYRANAGAFVEELEALDRAIADATATIPDAHRDVLIAGDSWEPFGRRYGLRIVPAAPVSDWSDPSEGDLRRLVDQARKLSAPVLFGSHALPESAVARIAEEADATYVDDLLDAESVGQADGPAHSFAGMMVHDTRTLVDHLGGDSAALAGLDP